MNTKIDPQSNSILANDYNEEEGEEEDGDEVYDLDDVLYDGPVDLKRLALPELKSNGIRTASIHFDSLLFIGLLFSICFL